MAGQQFSGILLLILALQVLPISDTVAKYLSTYLPIVQVIWARFFFHCVATGAYTVVRYGPSLLLPNLSWILTARSAALFVAVGLFYVAIHYMPLTTALTLWFIEPFLLTILAMVFFREQVAPAQWWAIGVGFVGILLAIRPTPDDWQWTYVVGVLAGLGYALFLLLTRLVDSKIPPIVSVYQTGLVGCLASSILVIPVWQPPTVQQWAMLAAIGLVAATAHFFIIKAFERAEASTLAPFTYAEIIAATILGYIVFGDAPDIWTYAGLAIIIASAVILASAKRTRNARA